MNSEPVTILIVEDDNVDKLSIERALSDLKVGNPLMHAKDGMEALGILRGAPGVKKLQGGCIILLDLNMPRLNGFQFLEALREDPALKDIDVFVLTTSETDADIVNAYELEVKGYIFKSDLKDSLEEALASLSYPWSLMPPLSA